MKLLFCYTVNIKTLASALLLLTISSFAFSQQLSEMKIVGDPKQEPSELVAKDVRDANGETCAGLIIYTDLKGLTYQSYNGIVKCNSESGKDFLFISPEERVIEVFCSEYAPLKIVLLDVGIHLKSGQTWSLKITGNLLLPVNILVKPEGTSMSIDSINVGTSQTQQFSIGRHSLKLEKEGYTTIDTTIEISRSKTLFNFRLQEEELLVANISTDPPDAKILLNQYDKGQTNKGLFLLPGKYSLQLIKPGYENIQTEIEVNKAKQKFFYRLKKTGGTLHLVVNPPDAHIYINRDDYTGKTEIDLPPSKYRIEIDRDGYRSMSETFEIQYGKTLEKGYTLKQVTGALRLTAVPQYAHIILRKGNKIIREWDDLKIIKALQIGKYEIEVSAYGYKKANEDILIEEDETLETEVVLEKEYASGYNVNRTNNQNAESGEMVDARPKSMMSIYGGICSPRWSFSVDNSFPPGKQGSSFGIRFVSADGVGWTFDMGLSSLGAQSKQNSLYKVDGSYSLFQMMFGLKLGTASYSGWNLHIAPTLGFFVASMPNFSYGIQSYLSSDNISVETTVGFAFAYGCAVEFELGNTISLGGQCIWGNPSFDWKSSGGSSTGEGKINSKISYYVIYLGYIL